MPTVICYHSEFLRESYNFKSFFICIVPYFGYDYYAVRCTLSSTCSISEIIYAIQSAAKISDKIKKEYLIGK